MRAESEGPEAGEAERAPRRFRNPLLRLLRRQDATYEEPIGRRCVLLAEAALIDKVRSTLTAGGVELASALDRIAAARGCAVPETSEQREWVARFVRDMLTAGSGDKSTTPVSLMKTPHSGRP